MIHETALISRDADMGKNVSAGPFSIIEAGAKVGDGCLIGPHSVIMKHTTLGANCKVHAGAVIGDLPQDLAFAGGESFVKIGANCVLREGVTIHRGTKAGTTTELGNDCYLMAMSHVAHNVKIGNNVIMAGGALVGGYVEIADRVFVSGNCLLHQFVRIGRLAMMGGGSGVSKDVPPFCTVEPLEKNTVAGLNTVGMRRAGLSPQDRAEVRRVIKALYMTGRNVTQAVEEIRKTFTSPLAAEICDFVKASKKGICAASFSNLDDEG